jgi:polyhydroxyalkanoate synthesis regulator phasin
MENKLLLELSRMHQIMGIVPKLTINEGKYWGWLDDLIKNSPKAFKNFDEIIKSVRRGVELSDDQIDEVVNGIKSAGKLTEEEATQLKNLLKNDDQLRKLLNSTDDFLTDLKKLYPDGKAPDGLLPLAKSAQLSKGQINTIVSSTVSKAVSTTGSRANKLLINFENTYFNYLDTLFKNGEYLNNVDEVYDIMDGKLNDILKDNVKKGNISGDVAQKLYDELTVKFRQSQKIKNKIAEIEADGRVLGNPKTTSVTNFNDVKTAKGFEDIKVRNADGTKKIKEVSETNKITRKKTSSLTDEQGRPLESVETLSDEISNKYNNLKNKLESELTPTEKTFIDEVDKWKNGENNLNKIDDLSKKLDDDVIDNLEQNIDDPSTWGPMLDDSGQLSPAWSDIFFKKMFQGPWGETLVNIFRGLFRKPEEFILDAKQTLSTIQNKFDEFSKLAPGDSAYKRVKSELDVLSARLKSDMMLSQTKEQMFVTQWNSVKKLIEDTLSYSEAQQLINFIGKSGDARVSIESFVEWTIKNSKKPSLIDVLKQYNTFGDWVSSTKFGEWTTQYKELWKNEGKFIDNFKGTLKQMYSDFLTFTFVRLPNLLTFGVFSLRKELLQILKGTGRLRGLGGIKNIILLYIRVTIISNLVHPFIDLLINSFGAGLEFIPGFENINLEKKTVWNQFVSDCQQRIPLLGNDFEWNPFYNPLPKNANKLKIAKYAGLPYIEAEDIGFRPAPLPNIIFEGIFKLLNKDTSEDQVEKLETEAQQELNDSVNDFYKNLSPEAKEKLKTESNYNNLKVLNLTKPDDLKFYGLTQDDSKKLSEHMYFKVQGVKKVTDSGTTKEEKAKSVNAAIQVPTLDNILGQTWVCSVKPKVVDGVDVCNGESWRVLIYNDRYLKKDKNFEKFINDPENTMSRKYVYVSNKSQENEARPDVGSNNKNLKPIMDLLPKLK